jgi:acyl carrier protein
MAQNQVLTDIATTLGSIAGIDPAEVAPETSITGDLDVDSMTMVEVIVALEDKFGLLIPDDEWSRFATVGDLAAHLERAGVVAPS